MKTLLLIDANSLIHRCFHALPPLVNSKGEPVGALYGISNILLKIIENQKPEYAAACFDRPEPTFRKEKFSDYKAKRPKAPDELVAQIIAAKELFESFSIKTFDAPGYEADDIIGTLVEKFKNQKDLEIIILTGDLDSLQLIEGDKIKVQTFKKGISDVVTYNKEAVLDRYGILPSQLIDYKALVGDPSDNIPGVPQIGPKTASEIIKKYKTLDNFLKNGQKEKAFEKISSNKELALLSKELVTINRNAPIDVSLKDLKFLPNQETLEKYFKKNSFLSILKRINKNKDQDQLPQPLEQLEIFPSNKELSDEGKNPKDLVFLTLDSIKTISEKDLSLEKIKVGYDLKNLYKIKKFKLPIFDIKIALQLLGIEAESWQEASKKIFKKNLSEEIFIKEAYFWLSQKINRSGLEKVTNQIEMPLVPVIARMEENGVLVDKKTLNQVDANLIQALEKSQKKLSEIIGKDINPNSPKQLLDYFQNKLHLKIKSTSAQAIDKIKEKNPLLVFDYLLEYRQLSKLKTTYIDSFKKLISFDGRIHPTFLQLGASTGRLSCQNPNLQNIPAESEWAPKIRDIFVAPKNYSLVSFDYSQIELRVLASLSKDKNMIEAFMQGLDIHLATAQKIFNAPNDKVTPQMRRIAKTLNFGIMYGMGPRAFAKNAGISLEQAKEFIKKYFQEFKSIKEWEKQILSLAKKEGVVRNINGRIRDVHLINSPDQKISSEAERAAKNMPSQSLAADILKLAMIKTDEYIQKNFPQKIKMILSIHDELIFEIEDSLLKKEKESDVVKDIKEIMTSVFKLKVPLKVECKMGKKWGSMK